MDYELLILFAECILGVAVFHCGR